MARSFCGSFETNTFHHISSFKSVLKNACKNSLIGLEDLIFLLLINSKHGHLLLNRLPARFYRILCIFALCTQAHRLTSAYKEMFTTADGAMALSRCVQVRSPLYEQGMCRNEKLPLRRWCEAVRRAELCVCSPIMTFTILYPRTFHTFSLNASLPFLL